MHAVLLTFRNLAKPNLVPAALLFFAMNTSTTSPTSLNRFHIIASDQSSGKLVKKNEVAFPPNESLFNGDDTFSSAALFILHAQEGAVFQRRLSFSPFLMTLPFYVIIYSYILKEYRW
ncbi:hypothetical protein LXL04_024923 [Taraxacum kok-saghyz]